VERRGGGEADLFDWDVRHVELVADVFRTGDLVDLLEGGAGLRLGFRLLLRFLG
jgi:hypothetical protein